MHILTANVAVSRSFLVPIVYMSVELNGLMIFFILTWLVHITSCNQVGAICNGVTSEVQFGIMSPGRCSLSCYLWHGVTRKVQFFMVLPGRCQLAWCYQRGCNFTMLPGTCNFTMLPGTCNLSWCYQGGAIWHDRWSLYVNPQLECCG